VYKNKSHCARARQAFRVYSWHCIVSWW